MATMHQKLMYTKSSTPAGGHAGRGEWQEGCEVGEEEVTAVQLDVSVGEEASGSSAAVQLNARDSTGKYGWARRRRGSRRRQGAGLVGTGVLVLLAQEPGMLHEML